jgi:hypothetical protein
MIPTRGTSAAGLTALDAFRKRFNQVATVIVHHEGHTGGRPRGWSGIHAAVDNEYRAERGNDELLRLTCTKAKEARRMDPMAFEFADVDLGITNEDGEPVTSAVLNHVDYFPDSEGIKNKPLGEKQAIALEVLKELEQSGKPVSLETWKKACIESGLNRFQIRDCLKGLENRSRIVKDGDFIFSAGREKEGVRCGGILYIPPHTSHTSPRENLTHFSHDLTSHTPGDMSETDSLGQTGIPKGIPPEEYRECYNTAYSAFINEGLPPNEADRKAREEIREFIAGYDLSGVAVSSPITPDEEIEP